MTGLMIGVDVAVMAMLGVALWRLTTDPSAAWREREQRLREAVADLRILIAEAEREARVVDERLAEHVERLRGLLRGATAAPAAPPVAEPADDYPTRARRVRELAARATPLEEIARRLEMPVAEVRLLVGLQRGRGATPAPGKKDAARTAA